MTVAEMEQRLIALEGTVAQLVERVSRQAGPETSQEDMATDENALLPGVEYPVVLSKPPRKTFHFIGKIVSIKRGPRGLSLSDSEWASLNLESEDD